MSNQSSDNPPVRPLLGTSTSGAGYHLQQGDKDDEEKPTPRSGSSSSTTYTVITKEGIRWEGPALPSLPTAVQPGQQDEMGMPFGNSRSRSTPAGSAYATIADASLSVTNASHGVSVYNPYERISSQVIFKEDFNYEGRTRIEKRKDELLLDYDAYLQAHHTDITHLLQDVVLNLLIHRPERPLKEIRSYVRSRKGM